MTLHLLKQGLLLAPVLLGISILTFSTLYLVPGDPAEVILREQMEGQLPHPEAVESLRRETGLDASPATQYGRWLRRTVHGDLGISFRSGEPVLQRILDRLPATGLLGIASLLVALAMALPAGLIAAVRRDSAIDHATMLGALIGVSIPNFWFGLLLILSFSVTLGLLPVAGGETVAHVILPAVTLGSPSAAILARLTRTSLLEILEHDYIRTARAKGLSEMAVLCRHALRNAAIPIITVAGSMLRHFLEGAVIVETVFAWPGIGSLIVEAIFSRDFPMVQGCVLFFALGTVGVNLTIDVLYTLTDPRVTFSEETIWV